MLAAGLGLVSLLATWAPGPNADLALRPADPDMDLAALQASLAAAAEKIPEAQRAPMDAYLAAVARVLELEQNAALLHRAGGKAMARTAIAGAAKELAAYPHLVARLAADDRAMDRIDAVLAKADEEKWPDVVRLGDQALGDPAVLRIAGPRTLAELKEARHRADWETGLLAAAIDSGKEPAGTLAKLAGTFLVALALVALNRDRSRKKLRYEIALYDHAKGLAAPDEPLKARLLDELRLFSLETSVTAERAADLGTVVCIRSPGPDDELREIASRVDPSAVLGIGLLQVPLGVIWQWLVRLFFPPAFVWRGDLSRYAGETRLELEVRDQRAGAAATKTHRVRVPGVGEEAVVEAVRQLAYRIVHAALKKPDTASPEAFAAYEGAHALLARAGESATQDVLQQARECLERAIAEDPDHLPAQLRLANVVGRLGELDLAATMIEKLRQAAGGQPSLELRYEEARTYAQFQDYGRVRRALRLVNELLKAGGLTPAVELNARSLRATITAALLAMIAREKLDGTEQERLETQLKEELAYFDQAPEKKMDVRAFALARALAHAAHGTYLLERDARAALAVFRTVLIGHPELLAAQLGLAKAYRMSKPAGWFDQARPCLERAERLAPKSDAVHYEFGSALLDCQPPNAKEAKEHLEKAAGRNASALYKLGVLLAEEKPEDLEGMRMVSRAIQARQRRAPLFWTEKLVRLAIVPSIGQRDRLSMADLALRSLLDAVREAGESAEEAAQWRKTRKYLLRASEPLAAALARLSGGELGDAAAARALVKTLREVQQLTAGDAAGAAPEERGAQRATALAEHLSKIEAGLALEEPAAPEDKG